MELNKWKALSDRDHMLNTPGMYIESTSKNIFKEYILEDNKIIEKEIPIVKGLLKIINEIIDNSIDEAVKTNFKHGTNIKITIEDYFFEVEDNGRGIPVKQNSDGRYIPEMCWNAARAGSNFDKDENDFQTGTYGVGSYATNVFSDKFTGITDDGEKRFIFKSKNNAETSEEEILPSKKQGTLVKVYPDFTKFEIDKIDEIHKNLLYLRCLDIVNTYPNVKITFNKEKINGKLFKNYLKYFSDVYELYQTDKYKFAILSSDGEFKHKTHTNGLYNKDGGSHLDIISNNITKEIKETLSKKKTYKDIKHSDIKNHLMIILFANQFPKASFNSQTKEKLVNSIKETNAYLGKIDYKKIAQKIIKIPEILDPITELFKAKEQAKRNAELKKLNRTKKIKSDKYYPATAKKKYLCITEGASATGGLMPVLGRDDVGYYELKGKPLNAYKASQSDFTKNKELSELYKIIQNGVEIVDKKDGDWYVIELDGEKIYANENDEINIKGEWILVSSLLS